MGSSWMKVLNYLPIAIEIMVQHLIAECVVYLVIFLCIQFHTSSTNSRTYIKVGKCIKAYIKEKKNNA